MHTEESTDRPVDMKLATVGKSAELSTVSLRVTTCAADGSESTAHGRSASEVEQSPGWPALLATADLSAQELLLPTHGLGGDDSLYLSSMVPRPPHGAAEESVEYIQLEIIFTRFRLRNGDSSFA